MRNKKGSLYGAGDYFDTDSSPEEEEIRPRKRAVRLDDIETDGGNGYGGRGKSGNYGSRNRNPSPREIIGDTALRADGDGKRASNGESGSTKSARGRHTADKTATGYAMTLVSSQAMTERALRDKLARREYGEEETEEAVAYVKRFGYVNDKRLAEAMIEKLAARHYGRFKICRYLASKGIDGDIIESLDFSEIDFPRYCASLIRKYPTERRDAMLRAVKNAGYSLTDFKAAMRLISEEEE